MILKYSTIFFLLNLNLFAVYYPISIPTRVSQADKKFLAGDLYSTDTTKKRPVILIQTPYNKDYYHYQSYIPSLGGGVNIFVDTNAYNFVVVDWRGFYGSKDADVTGYNRGLDGYDIVEWIAQQSWSNGKVGTYGGSALGAIQFQTAKEQPPHLVCAVPMIKDFKTKYSDYYYGGDYRKEHVESLVKLGFTTETVILSHPDKDILWNSVEKNSDYADKINIPMLLISGWFDHFPSDVLRAFHDLRTQSSEKVKSEHKLIFGPWLHMSVGEEQQGILFFPEASGIPVQASRRFFDYYLRNAYNDWIGEPVTKYFEMGTNTWKTCDDWLTLERTYDTLYLGYDRKLLINKPQKIPENKQYDTLYYDPKNPSLTVGGSRFNPFDKTIRLGPQDQKEVESRSDALIYSTDTLNKNFNLEGVVKLEINVICNREDTDYSLRLCDVYPDGKSVLLTQGIRRMRFRNSYTTEELMKPDSLYKLVIELSDISHVFLKGHQIRVILTGSNSPMFDLNLNNGKELYKAGDTVTARSQIVIDPFTPSRIIFPKNKVSTSVTENYIPENSFLLYPNPSNESVKISFFNEAVAKVKISINNILGSTLMEFIKEYNAGNQNEIINVSGMQAGVYFLKIDDGRNVRVQKLFKH